MELHKKNRNAVFISILLLLSLAIRLFYLPSTPIYGDGAVYAEIIDEFIHSPAPVPYFMGHIISWKPPLGFAVYSFFIYLFNSVTPGVPLEVIYRLPPIIFGVLSTLAVYFLARKLYGDDVAFLSSLIFTINPVAIVVSEDLLLETMVSFLLISGVLLYMEGEKNRKYIYYAGLVGALLFFTKSIIAFLLPALGIAYYLGSKKMAHDAEMGRSFLISLSAVPLAMILYALIFHIYAPLGQGADIRISYIYDIFFRVYGSSDKLMLLANTIQFLRLTLPWSIMFFGGLLLINLKNREDRFIYAWLVLMLVFLGANQFYVWYLLLALPPFSIVCARVALQIRNRKFFIPVLFLFFMTALPHLSNPEFMEPYLNNNNVTTDRVEVGLFLRDKTNIMTISEDGLPEIVFYKFHGERTPDYAGFDMKVLKPDSLGGYIAYKTVYEVALGLAHSQNLTNASEVEDMIANSSNNAHVVMDSKVYETYSKSPLQNYSIEFNSSHGNYIVLKRVT
ncbi:MAG: glycosyltransferase family 39 protein [Candidatus Micrarchaeota archaeon]|nr:glycosyltransferase family 39 protein [Candidatus Micrarchaeota archaeon]